MLQVHITIDGYSSKFAYTFFYSFLSMLVISDESLPLVWTPAILNYFLTTDVDIDVNTVSFLYIVVS